MAHVAKYKSADTKRLFNESDRVMQEDKRYRNAVDLSRTHLNYELSTHGKHPQEYLEQRLSEVDKKCFIEYGTDKRPATNVMCSWVVTLPQDLGFDENEERRFFEETHNFLEARYGKENTVSSMVHRDETQPHLHFRFVPVIDYTTKKGENRQKLTCKDVITLKELQTFHNDLSEHLESVYGYDLGILNEATKEGNESIQNLKRKSAVEREAELNERAKKLRMGEMALKRERQEFEEQKTEFFVDKDKIFDDFSLEAETAKITLELASAQDEEMVSMLKSIPAKLKGKEAGTAYDVFQLRQQEKAKKAVETRVEPKKNEYKTFANRSRGVDAPTVGADATEKQYGN